MDGVFDALFRVRLAILDLDVAGRVALENLRTHLDATFAVRAFAQIQNRSPRHASISLFSAPSCEPHLLPRLAMVTRAGVEPKKLHIHYHNHCTFNVQISLPGCYRRRSGDEESRNVEG